MIITIFPPAMSCIFKSQCNWIDIFIANNFIQVSHGFPVDMCHITDILKQSALVIKEP